MPAWILDLIEALPSLITIILKALESNPPSSTASKEDTEKYDETMMKLKEAHELMTDIA